MSLLFAESFDGPNPATNWSVFNLADSMIGTAFGRNGTNGLDGERGSGAVTIAARPFVAASNRVIAGSWLNVRSGGMDSRPLQLSNGSGAFEVRFVFDTGQLQTRGTGLPNTDGPVGSFPPLTWVFVEMLWEPGVLAQVRINNQLMYSAVPTAGSGTPDQLALILQAGHVWWDDIYLADTSGTVNNDFLGPLKIAAVKPNAVGARTELTPSQAAANYALAADGDDATYNEGTVGDGDLYGVEDLADSDPILGLVQTWRAYDGAGGAITGRPILRTNSVEYDGADQVLAGSPVTYFQPWDVNPNTGLAWQQAEVNAVEVGAEFA